MENFWDTYETIPYGLGFKLFDGYHLGWLAMALVLCFSLCLLYRGLADNERRGLLLLLAALMVLDEVFKLAGVLAVNGFRISYLPLHLCSINIFISLSYTIRQTKFTSEMLYACSLPGAAVALLFPGWSELPFFNFIHLHSFTVHLLLLAFALLPLTTGELKPDIRQLPVCALCLVVASPFLYVINKASDSNFFFLNLPTFGFFIFIEEEFGYWAYIASLAAMFLLVWLIMYLPWIAIKQKEKKRLLSN